MIVKMKKVTFIVSDKDKEDFLLCLREKGIVHVKQLVHHAGHNMVETDEKIRLAEKALGILERYHANGAACPLNSESKIYEALSEIILAEQKREETEKNIEHAKSQMAWFEPWGNFSPSDIIHLREKGIFVKLYIASKSGYKDLKDKSNIFVIKTSGNDLFIASISENKEFSLPFEEVSFPSENRDELLYRLTVLKGRLRDIDVFLKEETVYLKCFKELLNTLYYANKFNEVLYGMREKDGFAILQGFCPDGEIGEVKTLAKEKNAGYIIEEPKEEEDIPTLIKNPKWLDIIKPVFDFINALPGYSEFDVSSVFLLFFSIFFAIIVGDAGYGLLFIIMTTFLRKKFKNAPREPFVLMYVLSFATLIWGTITGTWFGFEQIAKLPFLNALVIGKIDSFADENQNFIIYICFIIGVVHLTIAHLMRFIRTINSLQSLAQLGWILTLWGLFYLAGTLVIDKPFPKFAGYFLYIGIAAVLLFSNFQKNIFKGILLSLVDTPLAVAGGFSDIVSYLRLFAVGSASVAVAGSFNSMALNLGFNGILSGLAAALIIFFAHALNITLSFLAVIVHGIRLNMLEFSGHLGMQWSGIKYEPFKEDL